MFVNADAGDIDPSSETCSGKPQYKGAPIIADAIAAVSNNVRSLRLRLFFPLPLFDHRVRRLHFPLADA